MHITLFFLSAAVLLASGCSGPQEPSVAEAKQERSIRARTRMVELQFIDETIEAVGTVQSTQRSVLSSKLVANVLAVHTTEGKQVQTGEVLVELDDRDLQAQLRRAAAGLRDAQNGLAAVRQEIVAAEKAVEAATAQQEFAQATLTRYQTLLQRRSVAQQEYEEVAARAKIAVAEAARTKATQAARVAKKQQAVAGVERARAELANVRVLLSYSKVLAPLSGIVVAKSVEVGSLVGPAIPLLTIEEEHYRLEVTVRESAVRQLRIGQPATVSIDVLGQKLSSSIVEIIPATDPRSRTFTARLKLSTKPGLRSGLYGVARFVVGQRKVMLIPRTALRERGQLQGVLVLEQDNSAQLRWVKTGETYEDQIEILSGLDPGERLVVDGPRHPADGSRVEEGG